MGAQTKAELLHQLIHWHQGKHPADIDNTPSAASAVYLHLLVKQILAPVAQTFGTLSISYGFTSAALSRYIQRHSAAGTAPALDQHACCELNTKAKPICTRPGAACDFLVEGYEQSMHTIAHFICQQLPFDKLYFYGRDRPIHISVSDEPLQHLQLMHNSQHGRRYPGRRAFNDQAIELAKEL